MEFLKINQVIEAVKGRWIGNDKDRTKQVTGMVTDSRQVRESFCFVAVKGERVDGHRFIKDVLSKGASCVICSYIPEEIKTLSMPPVIQVDDTLDALREAAAFYRSTFDIPVVGIIGSVGKTSTKEYVASVLEQKYKVLKTIGNFNNDIGLPLTLMSVKPEHTMVVAEMGINHFGEMERLSRIARPDAVVFTNVAPCHLEYLGDLKGVLKAKSEVFEHMDPKAPVIINGDDELLLTLKDTQSRPVVSCGFGAGLDISPEGDFADNVKLPGEHMIKNALMARAVGEYFGLSYKEILQGIRAVTPVEGRSNIIKAGRVNIIDDCYNANPASMKAALNMLEDLANNDRGRIAILGDMGELGPDTLKYHKEIGEYAALKKVSLLICAGPLSRAIKEGYIGAGGADCRHYPDTKALLEDIPSICRELSEDCLSGLHAGEVYILVKASHSMGYSEVVKGIKDIYNDNIQS